MSWLSVCSAQSLSTREDAAFAMSSLLLILTGRVVKQPVFLTVSGSIAVEYFHIDSAMIEQSRLEETGVS